MYVFVNMFVLCILILPLERGVFNDPLLINQSIEGFYQKIATVFVIYGSLYDM